MALQPEDEEAPLAQEGDHHAVGDVGDETGAVPSPPPTLGREEKRDLSLVAISAIVIVVFLVAVSAIYVIARPTQPSGAVNYRLPPGAIPITYDLSVKVCLTSFHFWGNNSIVVNVTQPLKVITLHSFGLNITSVSLSNKGISQQPSKIAFSEETEFLILSFPDLEAWTKSAPVQLTLLITYDAPLKTDLGGLYRSFYDEGTDRHWLALTDFEPTGARHAFPCFDEPALKAIWTITLRIQEAYLAISNMPSTSVVPAGDGWQVISFKPTVPISTYLVCFVVSDFQSLNGKTSTVDVRVWTTPATVQQTAFALEAAVNILGNLSSYFEIPYPLPKMDLVAIPDFSAGAMENWGIVTFRQALLLVDDRENSAGQKQGIASVIAHEFGHQWFGNLVTMSWWSDLWLNEGFASFVENIGLESYRPEWKIWQQVVVDQREGAFSVDSLVTSHPIASNVSNPLQIFQLFDAISYDKGASVLRMLSAYLDSVEAGLFREGLILYLNTHKYGNADTQDLWDAIATVSHLPVPAIMNSWVNQAGYPYLTLEGTTGGYIAKQQRYFSEKPSTMPPEQVWYVPLLVQFANDKSSPRDFSLNFTRTSSVIPYTSGDGPFLINPGQTAFFRTLYPDALLDQLLTSDILKPADLAGVLLDQFSFIQAGLAPATSAFPTLTSINARHSREYVVWVAAAQGLLHMQSLLLNDPVYHPFESFVQNLVADVTTFVGWEPQESEPHLMKLLRPLVLYLGYSFNSAPVLSEAHNIFVEFSVGNMSSIAPDIRGIVYAAALRFGGTAEWNWMLNRYKTSTQIAEKLRALRSLPATSNATLLQATLELALDENVVRSQDALTLLAGVSGNPLGQRLAWNFFVAQWKGTEVIEMWFDRAVNFLAAGFSTKADYDMVEAFYKEHDLLSKFRGANQALESITTNIAYLSRNVKPLQAYFGVGSKK